MKKTIKVNEEKIHCDICGKEGYEKQIKNSSSYSSSSDSSFGTIDLCSNHEFVAEAAFLLLKNIPVYSIEMLKDLLEEIQEDVDKKNTQTILDMLITKVKESELLKE